MVNALWITLIGMGLVFVAILLLWGLMALLVQLTAQSDRPEKPAESLAESPASVETIHADETGQMRKRRAAAAAVTIALGLQKQRARPLGVEKSTAGQVSAWQAVQRAGDLSQRAGDAGRRYIAKRNR